LQNLLKLHRCAIINARHFSAKENQNTSNEKDEKEQNKKTEDEKFFEDDFEDDEKRFTVWRAIRWCIYGTMGYNYYLFWNSENPEEQWGYQNQVFGMNVWIHNKIKIAEQYLMEPPVEKF